MRYRNGRPYLLDTDNWSQFPSVMLTRYKAKAKAQYSKANANNFGLKAKAKA